MLTRTTTQLLEALRDPRNGELWRAFDDRYRPIITAFAVRRGLSAADAAEAAQMTLADFADAYGRGTYDRQRGRLRSWIIGIAQHRIGTLLRERARRGPDGEEALRHLCEPDNPEDDWNAAVRKSVLRRALEALRTQTRLDERTILAFELTALRDLSPEEAGAQCSMTPAEVYVARNRVVARLRRIAERLTQEIDEP